jgi:hypothetical protein
MGRPILVLCASVSWIISAAAAPRVDVEEGVIKDQQVLELRDSSVSRSREISRPKSQDPTPITTDGRSLDQAQCEAVRARATRADGVPRVSRMDWCD